MRILSGAALLVVLVLVASGFYWRYRLAPVMESPGVQRVPVLMPLTPVEATRHVDLGFADFDLPAEAQGSWQEDGNSLYVSLFPAAGHTPLLTIGPLVSHDDVEERALLASYAQLTGERLTYWKLQRRLFSAQPFSVWTIPFRATAGRTKADLTLVALKSLQTTSVDRIEIYENDRVGIIALIRGNGPSLLELTEKQNNAGQLLMVPSPGIDPGAVARALVNSYRITTTDFAPDALNAKLHAAGVSAPPPVKTH